MSVSSRISQCFFRSRGKIQTTTKAGLIFTIKNISVNMDEELLPGLHASVLQTILQKIDRFIQTFLHFYD